MHNTNQPHTERFYVLENPPVGSLEDRIGGMSVYQHAPILGEAPRCERCGKFRGLMRWLPPYEVDIETWGQEFGDIATLGRELVLSERLKLLCESIPVIGLTDFEEAQVISVRTHKKIRSEIPRYFRTEVLTSSAIVDQKASGFEWEDERAVCEVCLFGPLKRYQSVILIPGTWKGEHIFYAKGSPVNILVSEEFQRICQIHGMRNAFFITAETYSYDFHPWEIPKSGSRRNGDPQKRFPNGF